MLFWHSHLLYNYYDACIMVIKKKRDHVFNFSNHKRYPHEIWTKIKEHTVIHKTVKDTTIFWSEKKFVECHFFITNR